MTSRLQVKYPPTVEADGSEWALPVVSSMFLQSCSLGSNDEKERQEGLFDLGWRLLAKETNEQ